MKSRYLTDAIKEFCFPDHKMGFISGPRQCGKTTLVKMLLAERGAGRYWNWDDVVFRRQWIKAPSMIIPQATGKTIPLVALDEIHKERRWKRTLKGIYDVQKDPCDILVTGSACLNVYRRGTDSLLGRYFPFRLHPFSIREMTTPKSSSPEEAIAAIFERRSFQNDKCSERLKQLMTYGPFPAPLFGQNERQARLWRRTRRELVIREDLRDISHIPELSRIELMVALLPERVGSLFSINALREELEVGFDTIKRWLTYLKELYYLYEIKPWHRSIPRALKKEGKIYFWDFSEVQNYSARFENLVANHLLKACHFWTDTGEGVFDLYYVRNKEKKEIDFLIVKDGKPWLPVEVKLSDTNPSKNWKTLLPLLPCKRGLQLVEAPYRHLHKMNGFEVLVAGAEDILSFFV